MTVTALLVIVGAVIVFAAGWSWGRMGRPLEPPHADPSIVPSTLSLDEVLNGHPTGVIVSDRHGRIEFRNAAARRRDGSHTGLLLDAAIERHLTTGRLGTASEEIVELYGPPKMTFDVTGRPLPNGGSVVFVDDISERRRIDQVRTDFVANISHELKTPVGALSVLAETLEEETDPVTVKRVVVRMLAEAERATRTIDDLMELSRIESGNELVVEPVHISDIVHGALERVTELARSRQIEVSTVERTDAGEQATNSLVVMGDHRQLVSAIGNIVENAVKYSEPGSAVQVSTRTAGKWIEIAVSDQGAGIPQRDLDRIFERFYRVDRARSRSTGGTGLGLSIVRHVASNHDGEVVVTSTEGQGSTFVFRLPSDRRRPGPNEASTSSPGEPSPPANLTAGHEITSGERADADPRTDLGTDPGNQPRSQPGNQSRNQPSNQPRNQQGVA